MIRDFGPGRYSTGVRRKNLVIFAIKCTVNKPGAGLDDPQLREPDDVEVELAPGPCWRKNSAGMMRQSTEVATVVATPGAEAATVEYRRGDGTVIRDADTIEDGHQVALWSYRNAVEIKVTGVLGVNEKTDRLTVRRLGSRTRQPATGRRVIEGTLRVGETLTVDASGVTDANGTYNAKTGWSLNGLRNDFSLLWRIDSDDPNKVIGIGTGRSVTLDKHREDRRVHVSMCFRDDLDNPECRTGDMTRPEAAKPLVMSGGARTIAGSNCD